MVQINLLPVTAKKKRRRKIELKVKIGPLIFVLSGLMVAVTVVWVILGMRLSAKETELTKVDANLKSVEATLQKLNSLKEDKKRLRTRLEFMDRHLKREVFWAEDLNRLSDLVPPGIWMKSLILHVKKKDHLYKYDRLDINGSAISVQGGEVIDLIGGFMTALKKDEVFFEQFSSVELISSQRTKSGRFEMMDFRLLCRFK